MPTSFWSGYIVVITVVSLVALAVFVANVYFSGGKDDEVENQVWDHDLREGTAAAPIWWFWLIFALMTVSVVYLMLYPGLGRFSGALKWSQGGEIEASRAAYVADFGGERDRIANTDVEILAADPQMVASGQRIFNVHCAACHGADAGGQAMLFPNLLDAHWQWGDTAAALEQTIRSGRTAVMPPLLAALGEDGVANLANYVVALSEGSGDDASHAAARAQFATLCAACHGQGATGNPLLGAPDLTAGAFTYGGEYDQIHQTIAEGRTGQMPAFGDKLDTTQIRLLTAWLVASRASAD
jgi:cytochrome c oxidase cbb3-type subunit III